MDVQDIAYLNFFVLEKFVFFGSSLVVVLREIGISDRRSINTVQGDGSRGDRCQFLWNSSQSYAINLLWKSDYLVSRF